MFETLLPGLNQLGSVLLMLVLISILIIAHELGHFFVARKVGVKVERFGFGLPFGPTLWSKKIGDVEYCIHAALFGGYVSFPDDNPDHPLPKDSPERFENKSIGARFAVMVAGVTVNAVLGWLLMMVVVLVWGLTATDAAVGRPAMGYPAYEAGLRSGDVIVAVGERDIQAPTPEQRLSNLQAELARHKNQPVNITVLRPLGPDGNPLYADIQPVPQDRYRQFEEAARALRVDQSPAAMERMSRLQPDPLELNRTPANTQRLEFTVTPNAEGQIGINLAHTNVAVRNPIEAGVFSYQYLSNIISLQFRAFGDLFTGRMGLDQLGGPIRIVDEGSKQIQKNGIQRGLMLTAIISVILAVMNLLPIPALDGGHIAFLIIEAIKGSPVKQEIREQITQYGFLGLLGLIAFILLNDINNTFINRPR